MWPPGRAVATQSTPANSKVPALKHIRDKWLRRKAVPTPSALTPETSATGLTVYTSSVTNCLQRDQDSQGSQVSSRKRYQIWSRSQTTRNAVIELVTLAGTILVEVSQMTQGIPYVECLAKVIGYVAKASQELQTVETRFIALSERIVRLQCIIFDVGEDSKRQGAFPLALEEPFRLLENLLLQVINVLSHHEVSRLKYLKRFLNRKNVLDDIQKCEMEISNAIEEFNTHLNIQQMLIERDVRESLSVVERKVDTMKVITEEHEVRNQTRHVIVLIVLMVSGASSRSTLIVSTVLFGKSRVRVRDFGGLEHGCPGL